MATATEDSLPALGDDAARLDDVELMLIIPNSDDDDVTYAAPRPTFNDEKLERGDISDPVRISRLPKLGPGDDAAAERAIGAQAIVDLTQANQGFLVHDLGTPHKTVWRTTCEVCDNPLPLPQEDGWVCERGNEPGSALWSLCNCNWCLIRGQWLRGEYRPRGGRPPKRCGTAECTRTANRERQRRHRAAKAGNISAPAVPKTKPGKWVSSGNGGRW
jgi:hypothetical protein